MFYVRHYRIFLKETYYFVFLSYSLKKFLFGLGIDHVTH